MFNLYSWNFHRCEIDHKRTDVASRGIVVTVFQNQRILYTTDATLRGGRNCQLCSTAIWGDFLLARSGDFLPLELWRSTLNYVVGDLGG